MGFYDEYLKKKTTKRKKSFYDEYKSQKQTQQYVENFAKDYESFFSDAAGQYEESKGYGKASSIYSDKVKQSENLKQRGDLILSWLESSKGGMDEESYKNMYEMLTNLDKNSSDLLGSFEGLVKAQDFYKQETEYQDWLNAPALDYENLDKLTDEELDKALEDAKNSEFATERLQIEKYRRLKNNSDFAENSAYESKWGTWKDFALKGLELNMGAIPTIKDKPNPVRPTDETTKEEALYMYINSVGKPEITYENAFGKDKSVIDWFVNNYNATTMLPEALQGKEDAFLDMTDQEVATFNYLFKTSGVDSAIDFLASIHNDLVARKGERKANIVQANGQELLFAVEAGLDQFSSGISNIFASEEEAQILSSTQIASAQIQEALQNDDWGKLPDWLGGSIKAAVYNGVLTYSNMLPSILVSSVTKSAGLGSIVLGASAAGNARAEMLRMGYTDQQASWYGALVGLSEGGLQYLLGGIGKLGGKGQLTKAVSKWVEKLDNGFARAAITLGTQMGSEALEEYLQPYIESVIKGLVTNEDIEAPDIDEAIYSAIMGAVMAAMFNAPSNIASASQTIQTGSMYQSAGLPAQANLVGLATDVDAISGKRPSKYQEKISKGKNLSKTQLGLMAQGISKSYTNADKTKIKNAVKNRLTTLGETGNVDTISDIIAKSVVGEELSLRDKYILAKSEKGTRVLNELNNDGTNAPIQEWTKQLDTQSINPERYSRKDSGKTYDSKGNEVTIESIKVDNGKIVAKTNEGVELKETQVDLSGDDGVLFYGAKAMGLNSEAANQFYTGYKNNPQMSAAEYAKGFEEAYLHGQLGIPEGEYNEQGLAIKLDEATRKLAYGLGKIDANYNAQNKQNAINDAKKESVKKSHKFKSKGKVHYEEGMDFDSLSDRQRTSLKVIEKISKVFGIDVYIYESLVDENGKRLGANGFFDAKDNSIHLDLFAGENGEQTMLFTMSHELTHFIKVWSPSKYKIFTDILMEYYAQEQGVTVSELVGNQIIKAKKNGRIIDADEAYEEVVADSCESMLTNEATLREISNQIKTKDQSLWNKIKSFFATILARIKAVYDGLNPSSREGQIAQKWLKQSDTLQKAWTEALVDAGQSYNAVGNGMLEISESTESAAPISFSERTWTTSEYVTNKKAMVEAISNKLGISKVKAEKYVNDITSIANLIATDRARLDYEASSFGSAFVSNVEYGGSFDFSTICKKRRLYTGTFSKIQEILKDEALSPDDILEIRNMLLEEKAEATCGLCYVEGSRANMGKFAKEFIRLYKRDNPNSWIPNMADVNTPDGVEQMRINHPEVYESYEYFWNHYGKLKDSDPALFASQQKPKLYESRKEYKGEILDNFKKDSTVEQKNRNGGIRMQSFSDFEIVHLIDTMQIIMDMSVVGLSGQAYTKVPEFALAFGNTGLKINLSLIAKGVDADGNLIFDDREGMPHETAFDLRTRFSKNVGTIIVVFTDEQLLAAMADNRIDYIIPFHRSQWKKGQYDAMGLPKGTKDYTYMQNEKFIKPTYHEYRGKMVRDKAHNYMPNEYWDFSKTGKENAEAYLEMCYKDNKRPKFYKLLDYDGNGRYSLKKDGSTDGYWKLLIDFKMYDNDGVGSPQMPVAPTFEMEEAKKMLDEYKGGHKNYPVSYSVVDKFVSKFKKEKNIKHSSRNSWNNVNSIQGLEGYTVDEVVDITKDHIQGILEGYGESAEIIAVRPIGSRAKGTSKEGSDLDIVVQYEGDIREDDMFNMLNDEDSKLYIEGIEVDINPIRADESGDIEDYLGRVYDYDKYSEIKYSTRDSLGKELSKEQQEFFKDSKVRDEDGNLMVVYHGTPNGGFTEFKLPHYLHTLTSAQGAGYYFTDEQNARQYMKGLNGKSVTQKKLYKVYLNITNPLQISEYSTGAISDDAFRRIMARGNYEWGMAHVDVEKILGYSRLDSDRLAEMVRVFNGEEILSVMKEELGYDGVRFTDKYGDIWVAWDKAQIKETTNKNPTSSADIRYSIRNPSNEAQELIDYVKSLVKDKGGYKRTDVQEYVEMRPEINFIEGIYEGDKTVKAELANFLSQINDITLLEHFSYYMKVGFEHKNGSLNHETWNYYYPYRGAVRTFTNAVTKRIKEIQTSYVQGTNLGVKNGVVPFEEVVKLFNSLNTNDDIAKLAKKVFATAEKLGVNVRFGNQDFSRGRKISGATIGDMVELKTSYFNDTVYSNQQKAGTILHEMIHVCTFYALEKESSSEILADARAGLKRIYAAIKDDADFKGEYGITNVHEMVAELADEKFVTLMKKKNLWQTFLDWLCDLFGIVRGTSAYDNAMMCLDYILDNPNIKEYKDHAVGQRRAAHNEGYNPFGKTVLLDGQVRYSVRDIVGASGKNYGKGVYLDSTLLSNLTEEERVEMVKEYVKELGGSVFTAFDSSNKAVNIHIVESNKRFKNKNGRNVPVYNHMLGYLKNSTKQEAIALVDELIITSSYQNSEPSKYSHGWLDNEGQNNWENWTTYIQDKENTIWEATLKIANSTNGEKVLYEIYPIKMVEQSVKPDTSTTNPILSQKEDTVKRSLRDNSFDFDDVDAWFESLSAEEFQELIGESLEFTPSEIKLSKQERRDAYVSRLYKEGKLDELVTKLVKSKPQMARYFANTQMNQKYNPLSPTKDDKYIVMFHGTPKQFNVFDTSKIGTHGTAIGSGIYFTENLSYAESYKEDSGRVIATLLNIEKPLSRSKLTISKPQLKTFIRKVVDTTGEDFLSNYGDVGYEGYETVLNNAVNSQFEYNKNDADLIESIYVESRMDFDEFHNGLTELLGFDGIIAWNKAEGTQAIVFKSNQAKDIFNFNPTKDSDIRFQDRSSESVSNRSLLANALESVAQNEIESKRLREYKQVIAELDADTIALSKIRAEIKELSFSKGQRDTQRLQELKNEAVKLENRISVRDKKLLKLESTTALSQLLEREKEKAYNRGRAKAKEIGREAVSKVKESRDQREAKTKLEKEVLSTIKWLTRPSKNDVKCPDIIKVPYAKLLEMLDFSSKRALSGGEATQNDLRMINALNTLSNVIDSISEGQVPSTEENTSKEDLLEAGYLDLPSGFADELRNMAKAIGEIADNSSFSAINQMSAAQVNDLYRLIKTLNHSIKNLAKLYANNMFENVVELGNESVEYLKSLGSPKSQNKVVDYVRWDNALPYYAFQRFGRAGEAIFNELMDAQDKLAFLSQEIVDFKKKTWTDKEAKDWGKEKISITLTNGQEISMSVTQAMGIYCLSRRTDADGVKIGIQHMVGGGIYLVGDEKALMSTTGTKANLSYEDIISIVGKLTDRQIKVAQEIQGFMSTVCADWGNEISMKRFLTKDFNEKYYYPQESNQENLNTEDPKKTQSDLFRLLNISATKSLTKGANNQIVIRDIFDVFANHSSDMARLNAFGMAVLDYMKWVNYRNKIELEDTNFTMESVKGSMNESFGKEAFTYVLNLIKDVNGRFNDAQDNKFLMRMMRMGKAASVGANLRVAFLQFTAYPRANMVLSSQSLAKGLTKVPQISKAKKYCGIALWKSFGFYDTNISRSIEEQIKGSKNIMSKIIEISMKGAEYADAVTWGALWNACEYEVAQTTKNKIGSEEFYNEVGLKLREVVYATQVVDSVLTRSQIMRSKSGLTQSITAFMSEPTLTTNILLNAGWKFNEQRRITGSSKEAWKTTRKFITKAIANFCITQIVVTLFEALASAWRDDDDDDFKDKFGKEFKDSAIDNFNPFNKIPIVSNISDLILYLLGTGYGASSSGLEMQWLSTIQNAYKSWNDIYLDRTGEKNSSITVYKAINDTIKALSSVTGLPMGNAMREVVSLWNNTAGRANPDLKLHSYNYSNEKLGAYLYDAIIEGDTGKATDYASMFDSEKAMESALVKALRTKDSRIRETAQALYEEDTYTYQKIYNKILSEGKFDEEIIKRAINNEYSQIKRENEPSK